MSDNDAETLTEGRAYYERHGWSGCAGSAWDRLTQGTRDAWEAAAHVASERERLATQVRALAVSVSGMGKHRDPCRLPDTPCICGLCDLRAEFSTALRALVDP